MQKNSKIAIILGTNAELIKCAPVMLELKKQGIPYYFIHTGQHSINNYCDLFEIKNPDFFMSKETKKNLKFWSKINLRVFFWNVKTMFAIRKLIKKLNLKYVLYHGDTMNTAMALGASSIVLNPFKKSWKNVHLEGGLRSGSIKEPMPEEFTRRVVGLFTDISLVPSLVAKQNLEKSINFVKGKVIHTGNTIIDSVNLAKKISKRNKVSNFKHKKFVLISIHRYENLKNLDRMKKIIELIEYFKIPVYWPLHENTKRVLSRFNLLERIQKNKNIELLSPLDYPTFLHHFEKSALVFCDGGSMQEESLVFKKPCIIMRNTTERPEGLETNYQFLSKFNLEKTKEKIDEYLSPNFKIKNHKNPYGEKGVSKKIVEVLKK